MAKGLTRCNVCGKTVEQVFENQMPISIHDRVGYGSKHDGSMLDLDICCDCFDKLIEDFIEKCVINPLHEMEQYRETAIGEHVVNIKGTTKAEQLSVPYREVTEICVR